MIPCTVLCLGTLPPVNEILSLVELGVISL